MLSHYINDKYYGGDENSECGLDLKKIMFFVLGLGLGLLAIVVFLHITRKLTKCSANFISHLRADGFEEKSFKDTLPNQEKTVNRTFVTF